MRVVHLLESLEPGGLERTVVDLATAQRAMGLDAEIFCIFERGRLASSAEARGIPVSSGEKRPGADFRWLAGFRRYASGSRLAIIHAHNPVANYLACAALAFSSARVVCTAHDLGHRFSNLKIRALFRASLLRTANLVAVSEAAREAYLRLGVSGGHLIEVIHNGVPIPELLSEEARCAARWSVLGVDDGVVVFGSIGRLVAVKNHALLLRAFSIVARRSASVRLVLIGEGPLRSELERLATDLKLADKLMFLGFRHDSRDLALLFDVYVQSSDTEGYSIALLEAASGGLPLIATDVGGNPAIVHADTNGTLVPAGNVDALASAMEMLLDQQLRRAYADQSRWWATEHASIGATAATYLRLYLRALGDRELVSQRAA